MTDKTETVTGEVVDTVYVYNDDQGVQLTEINLSRESSTEQYTRNSEYKLVRVSDE